MEGFFYKNITACNNNIEIKSKGQHKQRQEKGFDVSEIMVTIFRLSGKDYRINTESLLRSLQIFNIKACFNPVLTFSKFTFPKYNHHKSI